MTSSPTLIRDDVEVVEKTTPYDGYFKLDIYRLKHKLFEGGWSGEMTREIFERGHAVSVLPYDPVLDHVVLIEQFRPGAYAALASDWFDGDASPWLIECVAGIIEKGEDPEDVARRETVEETGCRLGEIIPVCHYLSSPGGTSTRGPTAGDLRTKSLIAHLKSLSSSSVERKALRGELWLN